MIYIILCKNDTQFEIKWRNLMNYLEDRNAYDTRETELYWGWKGYYAKGIYRRPSRFDEYLDCDSELDFQFMSPQDFVSWKQRASDDLEYCFIEDDLGLIFNFRMHDAIIRDSRKGYRLVLGNQLGYRILTPNDKETAAQNREDNTMNIKIERVIFSNPATIVIWKDGTKTVAKCRKGDTYSKEAGLAICYMKKIMGSRKKFLKVMKKWIPEEKTESSSLREAADKVVEAMKRGDLESAGKIAEGFKESQKTCAGCNGDPDLGCEHCLNKEDNNGDKTAMIPERKGQCEDCKYSEEPPDEYPCSGCVGYTKWRPKDETRSDV